MQLRPYQQQLITDIRLQYQLGRKAVLAVLPTGGGKTVCFSYIAEQAAKKGNRVLVLVHRQELLDQASRAMTVPHGIIAANRSMDLSYAVQVASVQTVARRLHLLPRDFFQLLVVDEAHHTTAGTWAKVIEHFAAAKLLGVTATPIRGDGRGLGEHYQSMVEGPTAQQLTDDGFLAAAKVLAPPGFDTAGLRKHMGDFDTKQAEQRVGTIMGDCLGHYRKHLSNQTAIAFCCSVAHAEAVAALFQSAGIAAASIDGSMDAGTRRELLSDLGTGRLKVLTSCALIGEGVDVPSVGGCILLRPTASTSMHLQMIGRCLRPSPGKAAAVVLDHVGNTLRLGHHLEPREWTLDGLAKRDREAAPSVKVCPVCFATSMSAAQVCRECGHVFAPQETRELKVVEGELVDYYGNTIQSLLIESWFTGEKNKGFLFGNPVMVSGGTIRGWKSGILVSVDDPKKYCKIINGNQLYIPKGYNKEKDASDSDVICNVLIGDEIQHFEPRQLKQTQHKNKVEIARAQSLDDLRKLAQQRGYKRGWAERVYQARLAKRYGG